MGLVRGPLGALIPVLGLLAACGSEPKKLACQDSIANHCALAGDCALTWTEAQNDTSFCGGFPFANSRAECGGYHVVSVNITDLTTSYYYDATTGMLAAIVSVDGLGTHCDAGPAAGFARPQCTQGSEGLSQCADGGADGSTD